VGEELKPGNNNGMGNYYDRSIYRRAILKSAAGTVTGLCAGSIAAQTLARTKIRNKEFRIPGEFERIKSLWLGYDAGHQALTSSLVRALSPFVSLKMLVSRPEDAKEAQRLLALQGIRVEGVEFVLEPLSSYFARDALVFASNSNSELGVLDFPWSFYGLSGWCRKRYAAQADITHCVSGTHNISNDFGRAISRHKSAVRLGVSYFMEGGSLEVNGQGLVIANQALVMQRNSGLTMAALQEAHLALPGVTKVIWLEEGLAEDPLLRSTIVGNYVGWGTGGHTDEFVRFADASTVLLAWPDDTEVARHPVARINRRRMQRNFDILTQATDTFGRRLKVLKVPMPRIIERTISLYAGAQEGWSKEWTAASFPESERRKEGDRVIQVAAASYMNFVIANGTVVVPDYMPHGTSKATQNRVQRILQSVFKDRQIQFVDAISANWVGGGPHCATAHEPLLG
jgi:agmatine deiminase